MKIIAEKYNKLKPELNYLIDEVIIFQAWKKTHSYIRNFNWYADTLSLDASALAIEHEVKKWGEQLKSSRPLHKLELVPAAKSEAWYIDKELGWTPKNKSEERNTNPPIRPLANITIRDQTWATAALLCLADAVETAQGDCSQGPRSDVYSYGNRLICDWNNNTAWFRWGNSDIYRKFFTDYQSFLQRPLKISREVISRGQDAESVYVVNFDLTKFYDNINREELIERLKRISRNFGHVNDDGFWSKLTRVMSWRWDANDYKFAHKNKIQLIENQGIPQGLVAAGFFANAYMIGFDKKIGEFIGDEINSDETVILHDYCRYVDDIRLVISTTNDDLLKVKKTITNWLLPLLKSEGGEGLSFNEAKTKITLSSDLDNNGSMANRIDILQGELSGPADREILDNASGILEGLLSIDSDDTPDLSEPSHRDAPLVQLTKFDHDIRSDTLKRFAANRLESIMRSKRSITPLENNNQFINESELLAKKLILAWMKDPSLGLVLKKSIEIYPSSDLFEPVFNSIFSRSTLSDDYTENSSVTAVIMDYILADIFRCCCDFSRTFKKSSYPEQINPHSIIELASRYAQKALASNKAKLFIKRQALLLLAIVCKPSQYQPEGMSDQAILHSILNGAPPKFEHDRWVLFEIAAQITSQDEIYASSLLNCVRDNPEKVNVLRLFAKRGGPFWNALWKVINKNNELKSVFSSLKWAAPITPNKIENVSLRLSKIISSYNNGFEHEASLIKLALGLLDLVKREPSALSLSPESIKVHFPECNSWSEIWNPNVKGIHCDMDLSSKTEDPRFILPEWILPKEMDIDYSARKIYWVGTIMRAAVIGSTDFTNNNWNESKISAYKGIRTCWYKRRMGMMHSPESLVGEYSTVTDWFSELLMRCLQWPGAESNFVRHKDIKKIIDLYSFSICLKARLAKLNSLYCKASNMPALSSEVERPQTESGQKFRVVTVQQLLPKSNEFTKHDIELNNKEIRAIHREHLIDVCLIAFKTLSAKLKTENSNIRPAADLIIFPELSVHLDDLDVLKKLANKTKAMIFSGLVFVNKNGKIVNLARWIIPDFRDSGRQWIIRDQGKFNITTEEKKLNIESFRPCQHIIEVNRKGEEPFRISGAICYDATDISLAADLRDKTDVFIVVAHNKDVNTFDNMAAALHYHMYQYVIISNIGEFGGSTIQAPFKQPYDRLISHVHGAGQISINVADIDPYAFTREHVTYKERKTKPAGFKR